MRDSFLSADMYAIQWIDGANNISGALMMVNPGMRALFCAMMAAGV